MWLDKSLLRSEAFRSLSKWALLVYLDFLRLRRMEKAFGNAKKSDVWIITNNGEIVYPYHVAVEKGISRKQFRDAIDELIAKGFLDITHQGRGGRRKKGSKGDMTTFHLDDRWNKYGSKQFLPAKNPRKKDTRKGRGWSVVMNDPVRKAEILKKRNRKQNRCPK